MRDPNKQCGGIGPKSAFLLISKNVIALMEKCRLLNYDASVDNFFFISLVLKNKITNTSQSLLASFTSNFMSFSQSFQSHLQNYIKIYLTKEILTRVQLRALVVIV